MSISPIKPERILEGKRGLLYRLFVMVSFTIRERLVRSRIFLFLYLLYLFSAIIGSVILVILSDVFSVLPITSKSDALALYYSLILLGFSITVLNDIAFWIIAFSTANLVTEEIKSFTVTLYGTKPVPRSFYILSRFLSIFLIIFLVAIIPIAVMVTIPLVRNPNLAQYISISEAAYAVVSSIFSSITIITFYIFMVFAISAIVEDRGASVLIAFIIFYSTYILGYTLSIYIDRSFQILSIGFWATSLLIVLLGLPWKDINWSYLQRIGRFLMLPNIHLSSQTYLIGAASVAIITVISIIIVLWKVSVITFRRGLE